VNQFVAFIILVLISPLIILIGFVIVVVEQDSIFFVQKRLGLHQKLFKVYKLRTMKANKITFIGKVLRKTGLDEIPQLFNIVKGDLNFIGPRPLTLFDVQRLGWQSDYYKQRWSVKPGLTGLAQLSPICHKKMSLFWDNYYVKHQNLLLDFKIITASFFALFLGKKMVKKIIQKQLKHESIN